MAKGSQAVYLRSIYQKFGYRANWMPNSPLEVGAIGTLEKGVFRKRTNLTQQGIEAIVEQADGGDLEFYSEGKLNIKTSGNASAAPTTTDQIGGTTDVTVSFNSENSVVFKAKQTTIHQIGNLFEVGQALKAKGLKKNWVIITNLIEAESGSVVVTKGSGAQLNLKADANVQLENFDIAASGLEIGGGLERNIEFKILAENGMRPLYTVMKLKATTRSLAVQDVLEAVPFDEAELDE